MSQVGYPSTSPLPPVSSSVSVNVTSLGIRCKQHYNKFKAPLPLISAFASALFLALAQLRLNANFNRAAQAHQRD